jgi:putative phosphoribosyl transferase
VLDGQGHLVRFWSHNRLFRRREEYHDLETQERVYRGNRLPAQIAGRTAILLDDGVVTHSTMRTAVAAFRSRNHAQVQVVV